MFDLNREIEQWRHSVRSAGLTAPEIIKELEEHLRDDIAQQVQSGAAMPAAFAAAIERIGKPDALRHEFALAAPTGVIATLWSHKRKLMLCAGVGLIAAVMLSIVRTPTYQSEAKILIRYAIADETASASIIEREVAILTGSSVMSEVAAAIGAERILANAGGGDDLEQATALLTKGLSVAISPKSNVVRIAFRHPDSAVLQPVLRETLDQYLRAHVQHRRGTGGSASGFRTVSNISLIRAPSPPSFEVGRFFRPPTLLLATGCLAGCAWVLAVRLRQNRSEKLRRGVE